MSEDSSIKIELTSNEALVLFDWLARFNEDASTTPDDAEERVLWNLEATLESTLTAPLAKDYRQLVEAAKRGVLGSEE